MPLGGWPHGGAHCRGGCCAGLSPVPRCFPRQFQEHFQLKLTLRGLHSDLRTSGVQLCQLNLTEGQGGANLMERGGAFPKPMELGAAFPEPFMRPLVACGGCISVIYCVFGGAWGSATRIAFPYGRGHRPEGRLQMDCQVRSSSCCSSLLLLPALLLPSPGSLLRHAAAPLPPAPLLRPSSRLLLR